jgi:hypothetical protein
MCSIPPKLIVFFKRAPQCSKRGKVAYQITIVCQKCSILFHILIIPLSFLKQNEEDKEDNI